MLVKCVAVWITMSAILASATAASTPTNSTTESAESGAGAANNKTRIYVPGGRPVKLGEFPFLALLDIAIQEEGEEERGASCSGSIPSLTTVLTSAHCDVGDITAYAGLVNSSAIEANDSSVQVRGVESVRKPDYPELYDIMICYVNESWLWSTYVRPVPLHLADRKFPNQEPSFVVPCMVMGFGQTEVGGETGVAHVMEQLVGPSSQCMKVHVLLWFLSCWMCSINVENKTMCQGDSGGPALCTMGGQWTQWGVNMGLNPDVECGLPKAVNVYVATAFFRSWIMNNIKDLPPTSAGVRCPSVNIFMSKALSYQSLWLLIVLYQH